MSNVKIVFYLSALFVVEATINVCIPLSFKKNDNIEDTLKDITQDIRGRLTPVDEEPNIVAEHVVVNITHPAIDLYGALDNLAFYNFHHFEICFLDNIFVNSSYYQFDVFNLTFPNLRIEGLYNLTGDLGDIFDIYGDGAFWLEAKNISLAMVNFTITVTDEICFPIDLEINLQAVDNHFENFMYDEELEEIFNGIIGAILPESISILWAEWEYIFDQLIEDQINDIFHKHNIGSVFKSILNGELKDWKYCYNSDDYLNATRFETN